jgi:hypothetical protein
VRVRDPNEGTANRTHTVDQSTTAVKRRSTAVAAPYSALVGSRVSREDSKAADLRYTRFLGADR